MYRHPTSLSEKHLLEGQLYSVKDRKIKRAPVHLLTIRLEVEVKIPSAANFPPQVIRFSTT